MYQSFQLRARATRNVVVDRKSTRLNSSHDSISLVAVSLDRKSTRLNSSHGSISYAVFCLKKKKHHLRGRRGNSDLTRPPHAGQRPATHSPARSPPVSSAPPSVGRDRARRSFFFNDTATTEIYTLSLHDALPIFDLVFVECRPASGTEKDLLT